MKLLKYHDVPAERVEQGGTRAMIVLNINHGFRIE
jgi:hypothetical protein